MKRLSSILIVLGLVGAANSHPWHPQSASGPGRWSVHGSYATGELPLESDYGTDDLEIDRWTAAVEYSLTDWLSVFAGGGMVNADLDGFSDSTGAWLVGARAGWSLAGPWSAGVTVEIGGWSASDSATVEDVTIDQDIDVTECTLAGSVSWSSGPWSVYGGPYLLIVDGDMQASATDGVDTVTLGSDIEADDSVGGFVGASWEPVESLVLTAEYRTIGSTILFGISKRF